jgi:hypothetical protein
MVIAHSGHWLVNLLYAAPVVIIGGGLGWQALMDRRRGVGPVDDEKGVR